MTNHKVKQGECIATIAPRYGYLPETLWDLPENAALKELRIDPNCLLPGDEVVIPPRRPRDESVPVDGKGSFQLGVVPLRLKLRLLAGTEPRAGEAFALRLDTGEEIEGSTDGDGWIDQPLPLTANKATLTLRAGEEDPEVYELAIGALDPADTVTGMQARLANLGHYFGKIDDDHGPMTTAALKRFQKGHDLDQSGELDQATAEKLRAEHDEG